MTNDRVRPCPDRVPDTLAAWQPPADVLALVAAGHLVMVEPSVYRRRWPDLADLTRLPSRAELERTSNAPSRTRRGDHR